MTLFLTLVQGVRKVLKSGLASSNVACKRCGHRFLIYQNLGGLPPSLQLVFKKKINMSSENPPLFSCCPYQFIITYLNHPVHFTCKNISTQSTKLSQTMQCSTFIIWLLNLPKGCGSYQGPYMAWPQRHLNTCKGTFLSEGTDVFVISPNRQTFYFP